MDKMSYDKLMQEIMLIPIDFIESAEKVFPSPTPYSDLIPGPAVKEENGNEHRKVVAIDINTIEERWLNKYRSGVRIF